MLCLSKTSLLNKKQREAQSTEGRKEEKAGMDVNRQSSSENGFCIADKTEKKSDEYNSIIEAQEILEQTRQGTPYFIYPAPPIDYRSLISLPIESRVAIVSKLSSDLYLKFGLDLRDVSIEACRESALNPDSPKT